MIMIAGAGKETEGQCGWGNVKAHRSHPSSQGRARGNITGAQSIFSLKFPFHHLPSSVRLDKCKHEGWTCDCTSTFM